MTGLTHVYLKFAYQGELKFTPENLHAIGLRDLEFTDQYLIGKPYYQGKFTNIKSHSNLFKRVDYSKPHHSYAEVKHIVQKSNIVNRQAVEIDQVYKVTLKKVYMMLDAQF